MSRVKVVDRGELSIGQRDQELWLEVGISGMEDEERVQFLKRKEAIDLYVANEKSHEEIHSLTGINRREINRLYTRCISLDPNGIPWGYRGLIPNKKIKKYELNPLSKKINDSRKTGKFSLLLDKYPKIRDEIETKGFHVKDSESGPIMWRSLASLV